MLKKIMQSVLAATVVVGIATAMTKPAEARRGGLAAGLAVGTILGLGIAGAYAGERCYRGPRQCDWVGRSCWYNKWNEYVCRGGERRCWRPTFCD